VLKAKLLLCMQAGTLAFSLDVAKTLRPAGGKGSCPKEKSSCPKEKGSFPKEKGSCPKEKGSFPKEKGSFPKGKGNCLRPV
jgi:hypothetical protein